MSEITYTLWPLAWPLTAAGAFSSASHIVRGQQVLAFGWQLIYSTYCWADWRTIIHSVCMPVASHTDKQSGHALGKQPLITDSRRGHNSHTTVSCMYAVINSLCHLSNPWPCCDTRISVSNGTQQPKPIQQQHWPAVICPIQWLSLLLSIQHFIQHKQWCSAH